MRGSIWAVGFPVCPALLVPARFVSHVPAAARRFACACRARRAIVRPSKPRPLISFCMQRGGGGNNFKNLDSLLGLKPLLVPPKLLGRFTPLPGARFPDCAPPSDRPSDDSFQLTSSVQTVSKCIRFLLCSLRLFLLSPSSCPHPWCLGQLPQSPTP